MILLRLHLILFCGSSIEGVVTMTIILSVNMNGALLILRGCVKFILEIFSL